MRVLIEREAVLLRQIFSRKLIPGFWCSAFLPPFRCNIWSQGKGQISLVGYKSISIITTNTNTIGIFDNTLTKEIIDELI